MDLLAPGARLPRRSGSLPAKPHTGRPRARGVVRPTASMQNGGSWAQGCSSGFYGSLQVTGWQWGGGSGCASACECYREEKRREEEEEKACVCLGKASRMPPVWHARPPLKGGALAVSPGPAERHVTCMSIHCVCHVVVVYVCDGWMGG